MNKVVGSVAAVIPNKFKLLKSEKDNLFPKDLLIQTRNANQTVPAVHFAGTPETGTLSHYNILLKNCNVAAK